MATSDLQRHQVIKSLMVSPPGEGVDAAIHLWEQLARQLISIVGEEGFNSLFTRSLFLIQSSFPWLADSPGEAGDRLAGLKTALANQSAEQVNEANVLLLITFTDLLASLIGEQLTILILALAWNIDTRIELARSSKK